MTKKKTMKYKNKKRREPSKRAIPENWERD